MKRNTLVLIPIFALLLGISGCDTASAILGTAASVLSEEPGESPLTQSEAGSGIKEALSKGLIKGVDMVSQEDGYFGNSLIRIPWPTEAMKIRNTLVDLGMNSMVDKVELSLNRAAEKAAKGAVEIFIGSIKQLTFSDAISMIKGEPNAATNFLKRTTTNQLEQKFRPVIQSSLDEVNATKFWGEAVNRYNQIPFIEDLNPDLAGFVTTKAIDGLFVMVEKEEKRIRQEPLARSTELLKRVFGYFERNPE